MDKFDIERGRTQLYPGMTEPPEMRWAFIRKVYFIVTMQILLTVAVAAGVVFVKPIPKFLHSGWPGIAVLVVIMLLTFITLIPLFIYRKHHPWNFLLLVLFTVLISFTVGVVCAFTKGEIIFEAFVLTGAAVVGLTLYTFWAVKRGKDFSFLGPFLFASLLVLIVFGMFMAFFRLGKTSHMVYGLLGAIIFSGYIVYDTNNLIKNHTYDEYIAAAIELYLDIINLFLAFIQILEGSD